MSQDLAEQMEHAAHEAAHAGPLGRFIGITIAVLGVLLAFCSAMVGSARTELIATMVEENGTSMAYQTVSTKYRMLQAQLQQLHALMPNPGQFEATEAELRRLELEAGQAELSRAIRVVRLETRKILNTVTPTHDDVLRFAQLIRKYQREREGAKQWAASYGEAIRTYARSAERYELAQLCAEIGIVVASVGLLLQSRKAWYGALLLGVSGISIVGLTYLSTRGALHQAEETIIAAKEHYAHLSDEKAELAADERLLQDIEGELPQPAAPREAEAR